MQSMGPFSSRWSSWSQYWHSPASRLAAARNQQRSTSTRCLDLTAKIHLKTEPPRKLSLRGSSNSSPSGTGTVYMMPYPYTASSPGGADFRLRKCTRQEAGSRLSATLAYQEYDVLPTLQAGRDTVEVFLAVY